MDPTPINLVAFVFGVACLVAGIVLVICFRNPNPLQTFAFRLVIALGASGVTAGIPGFFTFNLSPSTTLLVSFGGALFVFVVVYCLNPAVPPAGSGFPQLSVPEKAVVYRHLDLVSGRIPGQPDTLLARALSLANPRLISLYNRLL
jgi:hypothetical protein